MATKAKHKDIRSRAIPPKASTALQDSVSEPPRKPMEKFKIVKPTKQTTKSKFGLQMDDDLQLWIRITAIENGVTIGEVVHQALGFARQHILRSQS